MRAAIVAAALVLAAAPGRARADSPLLDKAQKAIDNVDFDTAKGLVDQALSDGGLPPDSLARAHHLAGECAAALGDDAGARDHFVRWLLLDPGATLDAGVSPKITEPFAAAKQQADQLGAMTIDVRVEREPGKLHVFLDTRDPLHMIAGLRVRKDDGQAAQERGTSVELPADDATSVTLEVLVLDDQNDQIAVKTVTSEPSSGAAAAQGGRGKSWPAVVRWPTWTALAVIGLGGGGVFAWETSKDKSKLDALNADSAMHSYEEAAAVVDEGERHARFANYGFIIGGTFAAIAAATFFLEPHHHAVEVAPAAAGADVGASAIVHF